MIENVNLTIKKYPLPSSGVNYVINYLAELKMSILVSKKSSPQAGWMIINYH